MNSFEGEMAFIGETARVMKSTGGIEPAQKTEAVSQMEGDRLLFKKEEKEAFHGEGSVR
jgi:hypothetical protein